MYLIYSYHSCRYGKATRGRVMSQCVCASVLVYTPQLRDDSSGTLHPGASAMCRTSRIFIRCLLASLIVRALTHNERGPGWPLRAILRGHPIETSITDLYIKRPAFPSEAAGRRRTILLILQTPYQAVG